MHPISIQIYESLVMFTWGAWTTSRIASIRVWNWITGQLIWVRKECPGFGDHLLIRFVSRKCLDSMATARAISSARQPCLCLMQTKTSWSCTFGAFAVTWPANSFEDLRFLGRGSMIRDCEEFSSKGAWFHHLAISVYPLCPSGLIKPEEWSK